MTEDNNEYGGPSRRRTFLKLVGVGTGASTLGVSAFTGTAAAHTCDIYAVEETFEDRFEESRRTWIHVWRNTHDFWEDSFIGIRDRSNARIESFREDSLANRIDLEKNGTGGTELLGINQPMDTLVARVEDAYAAGNIDKATRDRLFADIGRTRRECLEALDAVGEECEEALDDAKSTVNDANIVAWYDVCKPDILARHAKCLDQDDDASYEGVIETRDECLAAIREAKETIEGLEDPTMHEINPHCFPVKRDCEDAFEEMTARNHEQLDAAETHCQEEYDRMEQLAMDELNEARSHCIEELNAVAAECDDERDAMIAEVNAAI